MILCVSIFFIQVIISSPPHTPKASQPSVINNLFLWIETGKDIRDIFHGRIVPGRDAAAAEDVETGMPPG